MEEVKELAKKTTKGIIKEMNFSLNTASSGRAEYTTDLINGFLDGIIIDSHIPIHINITIEGYVGIVLYDVVNFSGQHYEILRFQGIQGNKGREVVNYSSEKIALNDKLKIEVKGPKSVEVKFVVRYT